jgi:hypothetical protein
LQGAHEDLKSADRLDRSSGVAASLFRDFAGTGSVVKRGAVKNRRTAPLINQRINNLYRYYFRWIGLDFPDIYIEPHP